MKKNVIICLIFQLLLLSTTSMAQSWQQAQKMVAADRAVSDRFGYIVDMDGEHAVIGVPNKAAGASADAGKAYVIRKTGTTWSTPTSIVPPVSSGGDRFGISVAVSGSYMIIGASMEDEDASEAATISNAGAAYIYQFSGTTWTLQQKIVASDRAEDDNFGTSVSISGDFAIVASMNDDEDALGANTLSNSGSVYVFKLIGGTWTQQQKLTADDRGADVRFGYCMAMKGDYAVVSCNYDNTDASAANSLTNAGSAYIFKNTNGTWAQQQKIVASDRAATDRFAFSVDIEDSYVVVGTIQQDTDASGASPISNAGAVYIFNENSGVWTQQQKIVSFDRRISDFFGWSVSISGEYLVSGAYAQDYNSEGGGSIGSEGGAIYFFKRTGSVWGNQQKVTATDRNIGDRYGWSVALQGDEALVGASRDEKTASGGTPAVSEAGSVYIVKNACNNPTVPTLSASTNTICSGGISTISKSGTDVRLDATAWHLYSGSCGGAFIESNTTGSFSVSPTVTTTYYLRGEGGCVNSGACGSITINVINTAPTSIGAITGLSNPCTGTTSSYTIPAVNGATEYSWTLPSGASGTSNTNSIDVTFGITTNGNIQVEASNSCGSISSAAFPITLQFLPSAAGTITGASSVCSGKAGEAYSISPVSGATDYNWVLPTGATIASGTNTTSITVNFGINSGDVTVYPRNSCGNGAEANKIVSFITLLSPGTITGPASVCSGATGVNYSISSVANATGYIWTIPSGAVIVSGDNTTGITVDFGSVGGSVGVTPTNSCGNGTLASKAVAINSVAAAGTITGAATMCIGQTGVSYSISAVAGATGYNWTLPTGAVISTGTNTRTITVDFASSSGEVTVTPYNTCGDGIPNSKSVSFADPVSDAGSITGVSSVCAGTSGVSYSIASVTGATGYSWTVPSGSSITSGANTNSILITFGSTSGVVTVTPTGLCNNGVLSTTAVTVNPLPSATITSPITAICQGSDVTITANLVSGATYEWFKDNVSIGSPVLNDHTLLVNQAGTYKVRINDGCIANSNSITISINTLPANSGSISGANTFCPGSEGNTFSISAVGGATDYLWEVTSANHATIASGQGTTSVNVDFLNQNVTLKVTPRNTCGNGNSSTMSLTVDNTFFCTSGIVFGAYPTNACQGNTVTFTNYSTNQPFGTTMKWTFGTGASPATANGSGPHNVSYNSNGNKTVTVEFIDDFSGFSIDSETKTDYINISGSVNSAGEITGTSNLCANTTGVIYSIASVGGATGYNWTVPTGANITSGVNTNSITVTFGINSGDLSVTPINNCGNGTASTLPVNVNNGASAAGVISGLSDICNGATGTVYSIASVPGATGYNWTVPAGSSITSGSDTRSIIMTFGGTGGIVSVTPTSSCGDGTTASISIGVYSGTCNPPTPQTVNGPTNVTAGTTVTYSVSAPEPGSTYSWTLPSGSSIVSSNADSSSITVTMGGSGGDIILTETNAAGSFDNTITVTVNLVTSVNYSFLTTDTYEAYPIPFMESALIKIISSSDCSISVKIVDTKGALIYSSNNYATNQSFYLGQNLTPGIYYAQIKYLNKIQIIKLIKI